jgi:TPR repeat protein
MRLYARALETGVGVPVDDGAAVLWLTRAAEAGDAEAACNLGVRHLSGRGVPKDATTAVRWLRVAADAGEATAMFNLGVMLADGNGVAEDDSFGFKWMKAAADRGDAPAMLRLAIMYRDGEGIGRDSVEAYYWSSLATESVGIDLREKAAAVRFEVGEAVSAQARAETDERIAAWRAARKPSATAPDSAGDVDSDGGTKPDKL